MQRPALTSGPTASTARSTTFSTFRIRSRPVSLARSYQNCANPRSSAPAASRPRASPLTISICAHWQSYRYTEEGLAEAVVLARQALAIDPAYAPAAVMVGSCRVRQRVQGWGALSADNVAEAVRLARQALEAERVTPKRFHRLPRRWFTWPARRRWQRRLSIAPSRSTRTRLTPGWPEGVSTRCATSPRRRSKPSNGRAV